MAPAISVARMQAIDREAIEAIGIPRVLLMDHAGSAIARTVQRVVPDVRQPVLICCGTGFNGGDGLSAARHLGDLGYRPHVALVGRVADLRAEPACYAAIVQRLGMPLLETASGPASVQLARWFQTSGLIVDALLGIGGRGDVREPIKSLIARINRAGLPVVSADVPSGLDADTGRPQGIAVRATATITFGLPKHGCLRGAGPEYTGTLLVDPITIPRRLLQE